MTEKQMIAETLKRLRQMKTLHNRYPNRWDKFISEGLTLCEKLAKNADFERMNVLFYAVTSVPESILKFGADLSKPRETYSAKYDDGVFDRLLEKHFGKGTVCSQIGELSDALTALRSALLNNAGKSALECLPKVRMANSALPEDFTELQAVLAAACDKIETLIQQGEIEHACDLTDAVHALPEIAASPKADWKSYRKCFVKPYSKKWRDNFFENLNGAIK